MGKRTRTIVRTLWGAAIVAIILVAAIALLPGLIGTEFIRSRVAAAVSRSAGGSVRFERMDLVLLPRPGAVVRGADVAIAGKVAGTAESLAVYPEILPLLTGTFRVARIDAKSPSLIAVLPERIRKPGEPPLSLAEIEERIAALLADAASRAPGLAVSASDGRLDLAKNGRTLFSFRHIDGRVELPPGALSVRVACRSDLFERLSATASLEPKRFEGQGRIEVARFRPKALAAYLFPERNLPEADSVADLAVAVRARGIDVLEADVQGATSALALSRGDRRRTLKSVRFSGTVRTDRGTTTVSLRELALGSPKLDLSGRLLLDRTTPRVEVEADVRNADLSSVRDAALVLAPDVPAVRRFFDVVRGGLVSAAAVRIRAASPEELGKPENIVASARLANGSIHVPEIELDFASVEGDVSLERGILEGRRLSTRLGSSRGRDGSLTLGLSPKNSVFHLDTMVHADLSELPPLLSRLIRNGAVRDALSRIEDLRGEADGRLVLGESTASVRARVDVSEMRLSGRYRRIPFPVAISRGAISYDGAAMRVRELAGTVGASSVTGLAGGIAFGAEPSIEELSGNCSLALGELHPWLASVEETHDLLDGIGTLEGTANISVARLQGPLLSPDRWRYAVAGEVKDLAAVTTRVPGRIEIDSGRFHAAPESFSFADARGRLLDASLSVSGSLHGPGIGGSGYDLSLDGAIGPGAAAWVSGLVRLPPGLRIRSPLSLSGGRLSRTPDGGTSFKGTLAFRDGPVAALDLRKDPGGLSIDRLAVRDAESNAVIALRLRGMHVSATFGGTLSHGTVGRIYPGNPVRSGRIAGNFEADIRIDRPGESSARGTLEGRDLVVPLPGGEPLAIETVTLDAQGGAIRVKPSAVAWKEQRLSLEGELRFDAGGARLDLDLASDRLDADRILAGLTSEKATGAREIVPRDTPAGASRTEGSRLYDVPVSGTLRLKAKVLRSGRFAWSPFDADIALSREIVTVSLADAAVCGIATRGSLSAAPRDLAVDVSAFAADREIGPVLECLTGTKYGATGRFTFRAHAAGRGAPGAIVRSLRGDFTFHAAKGRIHRLNLLSKILAVVNVTELFRGRFPDLGRSGFAYDSIEAAGTFENGKIVLKDGASLDGRSMGILARGNIDLRDRNVDLVALVAPLRTVDAVIRRIPILRYVLGGSLVSVPVGVRGDLDDPKITPLPPSEVGAGMLGLLERLLKAPLKVIEPVTGGMERTRSGDRHQGYQP